MKLERIKSWWQRLKTTGKSGIIISFISGFLIAMFEESIEEMIAWGISVVVTKAISVVFVVTITQTITQTIKVAIKKIIKLITYKKGADKMDKVKHFFKKLIDWFRANPLTMGASTLNLASSSAVGYGVYTAIGYLGWEMPDWALYLVVAVVSVLVACLTEWGILNVGWETIDEKKARCQARAEAKAVKEETKRIEKEAKAALEAEAAEAAKIEADAKATLEAEAKAKADAEKAAADAKAEAEHKARVQALVEQMRNQK